MSENVVSTDVIIVLPASLSFCGKVVKLRGSPYGWSGVMTPFCMPNDDLKKNNLIQDLIII